MQPRLRFLSVTLSLCAQNINTLIIINLEQICFLNPPFFTGLCSEREVSDALVVTSTVH